MNKRLSSTQLIILLFFCRHYSLLIYTNINLNLEANIYAVLIADLLSVIFLLPIFILFKRNNSHHLFEIASRTSPLCFKLMSLTSFLFFILSTFIPLSHFGIFMTTTIFPSASPFIIIFSMLMFCLYAVINGLEPIARTTTLLLPLVIIGILIITFSSFFNIDFDNFKPILDNPIPTILNRAFSITIQNVELFVLIYLLPFMLGSFKKVLVGFLGSYTISHELLLFTSILVLGEYLYIQQYPSYAIAAVAKFSIFQRLDSLYMGIWVFMGFVKISLYLWVSMDSLNHLISKKYNKYVFLIVTVLLLILSVYRNYFFIFSLKNNIFLIQSILFIICLIGFPLLLIIIQKFSKKDSIL